MPKGIFDRGPNFPCGHSRKQFYIIKRKYFNKTLQQDTIMSYHICKECTKKQKNAGNKRLVPRRTNMRWRLKNGRRIWYKARGESNIQLSP